MESRNDFSTEGRHHPTTANVRKDDIILTRQPRKKEIGAVNGFSC